MRIACKRCSTRTTIDTASWARPLRCRGCGAPLEPRSVATGWFAVVRGALTGPLTRDELLALLEAEPSPAEVPVWRDGLEPWTPAADVPELARGLASSGDRAAIPLRDRKAVDAAPRRDGESGKIDLGALVRQLRALPSAPTYVESTPAPVAVAVGPRAGSHLRWALRAALAGCSVATLAAAAWIAWEPLHGAENEHAAPANDENAPAVAVAAIATERGQPSRRAPGPTVTTASIATEAARALELPIATALGAELTPTGARAASSAPTQLEPTRGRRRSRPELGEPTTIATTTAAAETEAEAEAEAETEAAALAAPTPFAVPPALPPSGAPGAATPPSGAMPPAENPFEEPRPSEHASIDQLLERAVVADLPSDEDPAPTPALPPTPTRQEIDRGLDRARAAVAACGLVGHGVALVRITVAGPTGRVTSALVEGDFAGTPAGSCVAGAVRGAELPRFARPTFVIQYAFRI